MEQKPSSRADLVAGLCWIALGGAIVYGSWTMDRLENLKIDPLTAPGLVPGILGAAIALCGLIMTLRAARAGGTRARVPDTAEDAAAEPIFTWRIALSMAMCLGFALGLVGRVPFMLAAGIFLFLHIFLFELRGERRSSRQVARGALIALAVGAGASFVITMIFQEFFLVRLP